MRTLKVKCSTWQHVETFYERKLRRDKTLTIRVPFEPKVGSIMSLGLQLPNGTAMAIDGKVMSADADGGGKTALRLHLHGLTEAVVAELKAMVAAAGQGARSGTRAGARATTRADRASAPQAPSSTTARGRDAGPVPPAARPEDAPMSERVEPPFEPDRDELGGYELGVFDELDAEIRRVRECAAHQVLGVADDADVAEIRGAYFELSKRYHPDLYAKYRSAAIMSLAQDVFIYVNRAYDRMRDSTVEAGSAVIAGPALLPHDGWLIGMDDIEPDVHVMMESDSQPTSAQSMPIIQSTAEELMAAGDFEGAREHVAEALHADPRNRQLRALYYVISGKQALLEGDTVLASTQFEAALAHDRDFRQARAALDELRANNQSGVFPRTLR